MFGPRGAAEEPMSDTAIFFLVFAGFFVLRAVAATVFFLCMLPPGDRCPHCDAVTLRVQSPVWNRLLPMFRTSWCYQCNWHGMLRLAEGSLNSAGSVRRVPTKQS